jgi:hypothetical protein
MTSGLAQAIKCSRLRPRVEIQINGLDHGTGWRMLELKRQERRVTWKNEIKSSAKLRLSYGKPKKASPKYDSALFHEAEVGEILAKSSIDDQGCNAQDKLNEAARKFTKVTTLKPDFSIAYYESGVMWLGFLNYVQNIHSKNCEGDRLEKLKKESSNRSDEELKAVLRYDINFDAAWLQWSFLAYQEAEIEVNPYVKASLFNLAVERNIRAVEFTSPGWYAFQRLSWAIKKLSESQAKLMEVKELEEGKRNDLMGSAEESRLAGTKVFCQALQGRSWTATERQQLNQEKLCEPQPEGPGRPASGVGG